MGELEDNRCWPSVQFLTWPSGLLHCPRRSFVSCFVSTLPSVTIRKPVLEQWFLSTKIPEKGIRKWRDFLQVNGAQPGEMEPSAEAESVPSFIEKVAPPGSQLGPFCINEVSKFVWFFSLKYILLILLLSLSQFFPLSPPCLVPSFLPAFLPPYFMSMGHVYKFFGFSISYTVLTSPKLFYNYLFVLLNLFTSSSIPPYPHPIW